MSSAHFTECRTFGDGRKPDGKLGAMTDCFRVGSKLLTSNIGRVETFDTV